MSVKIRLKRYGTTKKPYYRIVVLDSKVARDGKTIEEVGLYHPTEAEGKQVVLKEDRIREWLGKGAIPSDTVKKILNMHKIFLRENR